MFNSVMLYFHACNRSVIGIIIIFKFIAGFCHVVAEWGNIILFYYYDIRHRQLRYTTNIVIECNFDILVINNNIKQCVT